METPAFPGILETSVKTHRCSYFFAALIAAGVVSLLFSVVKRDRTALSFLYSRPVGGEKEGEFDLFIGS